MSLLSRGVQSGCTGLWRCSKLVADKSGRQVAMFGMVEAQLCPDKASAASCSLWPGCGSAEMSRFILAVQLDRRRLRLGGRGCSSTKLAERDCSAVA